MCHDRRYSLDDSLLRGMGYAPQTDFTEGGKLWGVVAAKPELDKRKFGDEFPDWRKEMKSGRWHGPGTGWPRRPPNANTS